MAQEIERKFLLISDSWRDGSPAGTRMSQGYLSKAHGRTVRVRLAGEKAWLTIKGAGEGISRSEFEYEIPPADASELLALCELAIIDKTRYRIPFGQHVWEVDVFHGDNDGLVVAEVELGNEWESPEIPPWIGNEVSDDRRYANSNLSKTPFSAW
jgi:CYTH domain-containing protein